MGKWRRIMPLSDKELLITMIDKQDEKNRTPDNEGGFLKFAIKVIFFLGLFGVLGATIGPIFGTIIWAIILLIYAAISFSGSSSKYDNKNFTSPKDKQYRCKECGYSFRGLVEKCPNCGITFNLNKPESEKEHVCLGCGFVFKGKLERCPKCGKRLLY